MDQTFYNELIPPLLFFFVFLVTFSILELIVIFLLNRIGRQNWEFMIDVVIRSKVHYGKLIQWAVLLALAAFVLGVIFYTPLLSILVSASKELQLFALVLALVMALMYSVNIRKSSRLDIEKKIYRVIFFVISIFLYIFILVLANESYGSYAQFVRTQFVAPTVKTVEIAKEEREEEILLAKFRQQYLDNKCDDADYTEEGGKQIIVKSFLLIESDPELAFSDEPINLKEPKDNLKGKKCTDGENIFLLTGQGNWYWITEDHLNYLD